MADAGAFPRTAESNKAIVEASRYHVRQFRKYSQKPHKHCTFRHIYGIISVLEICFGGSTRMKMPVNVSPEIAAYIKALQAENSKLQNKNSELQSENTALKTKVEKQELQISNLTEMLVNSRKKIFGKSSEKSKYFNDAQMSLFNEAETIAEPSAPEPDKETLIAAHKRRKKRTKAEITENLKHIKQICDLDNN